MDKYDIICTNYDYICIVIIFINVIYPYKTG